MEALNHLLFNKLWSYFLSRSIVRFFLILYSTTLEGIILWISRWPRICGMLVFISNIWVLTGMLTNRRIIIHLTGFRLILEILLTIWLKVRAMSLVLLASGWCITPMIGHRLCIWCLGLIFLPHVFNDLIVVNLKITFVVWSMLSLSIRLRCWINVILCSFSWSAVIGVSLALLIWLIILRWSAAIRALLVVVTGLMLVPSMSIMVSSLLGVTSWGMSIIDFLMLIIFLMLRWLINLWFFLMLEHVDCIIWHMTSQIHFFLVGSIDVQDVVWVVIELWLIIVAVVIHLLSLFLLNFLILVWIFNLCVQDVLIKLLLVVIKILDQVGKFSATLMMQLGWTASLITVFFEGGVWSFLGQDVLSRISIILFYKIKNLRAANVVNLFWYRFLDHFIIVKLILLLRIEINLLTMLWIQQILLDILGSWLSYFFRDASNLVRKYSPVESILEGVVSKLTFCLLGDVVIMVGRCHPFLVWFLLHLNVLNLYLLFIFHISPFVDYIDGLLDLLTSIVGLVPAIVSIDKFFTWRLDNWWWFSLLIWFFRITDCSHISLL